MAYTQLFNDDAAKMLLKECSTAFNRGLDKYWQPGPSDPSQVSPMIEGLLHNMKDNNVLKAFGEATWKREAHGMTPRTADVTLEHLKKAGLRNEHIEQLPSGRLLVKEEGLKQLAGLYSHLSKMGGEQHSTWRTSAKTLLDTAVSLAEASRTRTYHL